jgi:uncharacterized membrane protein YqaE (UPF0057 family)
MRYLLALFLPWLTFFTIGRLFQGILCLVLQITLIGWLPATVWAILATNRYYADRRQKELLHAVRGR